MVTVFSYLNYRDYLKDYYEFRKSKKSTFSHRFFAKMVGFSSSGFLKLVMEGKRNLTEESIHKITTGLKLGKKESQYFENLVYYNQAKSAQSRELYYDKLRELKPKSKLSAIEQAQFEYYDNPLNVLVREIVNLKDFKDDVAWIVDQVRMKTNVTQVKKALTLLDELGFLKRDESGKLVQTESLLSTDPEVVSLAIYNYQMTMLDLAKEALVEVDAKFRDISSITIPASLDCIEKVKQRLVEFREDLARYINDNTDHADAVYQINFQLFPMTQVGANLEEDE